MPAYAKDSGSLHWLPQQYVDVGSSAYALDLAYVKVGGSLYQFFGGGGGYALLETDNDQTTLYTINESTGELTIQGPGQTLAGVGSINGIGTFTVGATAYALVETGVSPIQTTLYTINLSDGALTQQGAAHTFPPANPFISGIGAFAVGTTAYTLVQTSNSPTETTLYTINLTTGVLTSVGQSIVTSLAISGIGTFTVGTTAYALVETRTDGPVARTGLYAINLTNGVLTLQSGFLQTLAGVGSISGIGTFTVGATAYALISTGDSQTTLYAINLTTGILTQQGAEQTLAGLGFISGIGAFAI